MSNVWDNEGIMRILGCGSRCYVKGELVKEILSTYPPDTILLHGGAIGADYQWGHIAQQLGMPVEVFAANWTLHGKRAGIIRNVEMLDTNPDVILALWDGQSKGTKHTMTVAQERNIPVYVWMVKRDGTFDVVDRLTY